MTQIEELLSGEPSELEDQSFVGLDLQKAGIRFKGFYGCRFERCSLAETAFANCRFVDCQFVDCDLSLCRVAGCSFSGTVFRDSRVIGVNWTEASWPKGGLLRSIGFANCAISHSTFLGLSLRGIDPQEIRSKIQFRGMRVPLEARTGIYLCKTAGDNVLYASNTQPCAEVEHLSDIIIGVLDTGTNELYVVVRSGY